MFGSMPKNSLHVEIRNFFRKDEEEANVWPRKEEGEELSGRVEYAGRIFRVD